MTEPGQLKQQQVNQLHVLIVKQYLRHHVDEALRPDSQVARNCVPLHELLPLKLGVVLLLVALHTHSNLVNTLSY